LAGPVYNQGMNWITRCPECATVYQVSPDQLKAAKGWLRCGQCQHAFDSTGLILAWSAEPSQASVIDAQPAAGEPGTDERLDIDALLQKEDRSEPKTPSQASADLSSFEEALSTFKPEIEKAIADLVTTSPDSSLPEEVEAAGDDHHALPQRRWPSVLAIGALAVGLLAQWVWTERFALAEKFPATESVFQQLCRTLACEHEYARDVSGLVIDTSSFIQRDDAFELKWIVRNTTTHKLEMTALELTLQDAQGKPVVRRVFLPTQLGAPKSLDPAQVWQGDMRIMVNSETPVTGYRVLSFYP
jgi:predicted Zn finger-like uncharacterized protein